jgi:hypothetical protein
MDGECEAASRSKGAYSPGGKEKSVGEGKGTTSWDVPLKGSTRGKVGKAAKDSWSSYRNGSSSAEFLHLPKGGREVKVSENPQSLHMAD